MTTSFYGLLESASNAVRPWDSLDSFYGEVCVSVKLPIDSSVDTQKLIDHCLECTRPKCNNCIGENAKLKNEVLNE